jgi:hypothetical protein
MTAIISPLVAAGLGCIVAAYLCVRVPEGLALRRDASAEAFAAWARSEMAPVLAALIGVLFALPHLLPIMSAYGGETRVYFPGAEFLRHARYLGWALLPGLLLQLYALFRYREISSAARMSALSGLFLSLGSMLLSLPIQDPNEYKFVLLTSVPSTLLVIALWRQAEVSWTLDTPHRRRLRDGLGALILGAGASAIAVTALIYQLSPWSQQNPYVHADERIDLLVAPDDRARASLAEAFVWLREHTPVEAFVLERPVGKDELELSAVTGRRVVAAQPSPFTGRIRYQAELASQATRVNERLSNCRLEARDLAALFALPAPWPGEVYALVALDHVGARSCRDDLTRGVTLVFANDDFAIYRLERRAGIVH